MTTEEKDYYEKLKELDIDSEMIKALRIGEDPVATNFVIDKIAKALDDDIYDSRKNIVISYIMINAIRDNLKEIIRLKEEAEARNAAAEGTIAESLAQDTSNYDMMISNALDSCNAMFEQIQNIVSDIDVATSARDYLYKIID